MFVGSRLDGRVPQTKSPPGGGVRRPDTAPKRSADKGPAGKGRSSYDPEEGDYENGVDPGTAWEAVPADWVCPKCGAAKEDFWEAD